MTRTITNKRQSTVAVSTLAALMLALAAPTAVADWPMWGYDANRSGSSPEALELPEEMHLHWVRQLAPPRRAWPKQWDDEDKLEFDLSYSPVVKDGRLFVASMTADRLTAYDAAGGEELWRFYAAGPMRVAPAVWGGKVYAASDDGRLYCLDSESGEKLWAFNAAPTDHRVLGNERIISMWPARGGPVVNDGTVYFAAGVWPLLGTFVYALDAESGEVQWSNTGHATEWQLQPHGGAYSFSGLAPQGYLAVEGERLVVSGGRAVPGLFDSRDGALVHSRLQHHKGSGGYRVRIRDGSYYNHGLRLRLRDGHRRGRETYDDEAWAALNSRVDAMRERFDSPVFERLVAGGRLYVVTHSGVLYCFGSEPVSRPRRFSYDPDLPAASDCEAGTKAAEVLESTGIREGYALVLGGGDGKILEQLAAQSELQVIAIEADGERVDSLRRRLDEAGLYGSRVSVLHGDFREMHYPLYISSLVAVFAPQAGEPGAAAEMLADISRLLRPYGGKAYLEIDPEDEAVQGAIAALSQNEVEVGVSSRRKVVGMVRRGSLPGAGQWTHQHADAAQSVMSGDELVRAPLGPTWFGGPTHDNILPRHSLGPRPQVAAGRLVILGVETISARCVYTGRELWVRELPGIGHPFTNLELEERWADGEGVYMTNQPGAAYIGSPYVTLADSIYVRHRGHIIRLDPRTGETVDRWPLPTEPLGGDGPDWGHISVSGDFLITTMNPYIFEGGALGTQSDDRWDGTASRRLAVMDRHTGRALWVRDADIGFRHNAIASADGVLFINDLLSEESFQLARRRGLEIAERPRLYALDLRNGDELWSSESEVFGTFLSYSREHDVLLEGGSRDTRRVLPDEPTDRLIARRGSDGEILWERDGRYHGPVVLRDDMIIPGRPGTAFNLLTGENKYRQNPITAAEEDWAYWKTYGCGTANAGPHLLLHRSGAAGFTDLERDGGTGTLGGFRAGCTANLIPADGILNAPDYTRTCTCSYQNQTSLGLVHMPELEMWTFDRTIGEVDGSIKRLGLNLGAPGNRRAEDGTLWLHIPRRAPSVDLNVLISNTGRPADAPVKVVGATGEIYLDNNPPNTLDGSMDTRWRVNCRRRGRYNRALTYEMDGPVKLGRLEAAWNGPQDTSFRIETSMDGQEWQTVYEGESEGSGRNDYETYSFEPVEARFVRWYFGEHGDTSEDSRGRRRAQTLSVYQVRIGDLPFPEAYAYHQPKEYFRDNSLFVEAGQGINWVAASGVTGIEELVLRNVHGNGRAYDVNLHFMEPEGLEEGRRRFDIYVNGRKAVAGFDVSQAADGARQAVLGRLGGVPVDEHLHFKFVATDGSEYPPVLSGVELIRGD